MDEPPPSGDGREILRTTLGISKKVLTGPRRGSTMLPLSRTRQPGTTTDRSEHHGQPRREQRFRAGEGTDGTLGLGNEICGSTSGSCNGNVGCAPCEPEHADRQTSWRNDPLHGRAACNPPWRKPKLPAGPSFSKRIALRRFDFGVQSASRQEPTDSQQVSIKMIALSRSMLVDFGTLTETSSRLRAARAT